MPNEYASDSWREEARQERERNKENALLAEIARLKKDLMEGVDIHFVGQAEEVLVEALQIENAELKEKLSAVRDIVNVMEVARQAMHQHPSDEDEWDDDDQAEFEREMKTILGSIPKLKEILVGGVDTKKDGSPPNTLKCAGCNNPITTDLRLYKIVRIEHYCGICKPDYAVEIKNSSPNAPFSLKNLLGVFEDGKGEPPDCLDCKRKEDGQ